MPRIMSAKKGDPEESLRLAIVETGRIAYERGLLTSNDGNISYRLDDERVLITPSLLCKGRLAPEDLLVVDHEGKVLTPAADPSLRVSTETPMHLEAYKQRPDVDAVLHAHPPFATALTVAGIPYPLDVLPEVLLALGPVPTAAYAKPSSTENADTIRELIKTHNALLLKNHGSLHVGDCMDTCFFALERLEHAAKVVAYARMLGKVEHLSEQQMADLYQMLEAWSK